jgi:hypothetical protein
MPPNASSDNLGQATVISLVTPQMLPFHQIQLKPQVMSSCKRKPWKRSKELSRYEEIRWNNPQQCTQLGKKQKKSNGYRQTGITVSV